MSSCKTVASTTFLKDIINDVPDMSKIETGQFGAYMP